jgi:hypothetical protein
MIGITNNVSNVVAIRPPMTVMAIGARISDPCDVLMAIGSIPRIVVKAVIRTGRNRTAQA